jgi:hypothetical protein
MKTNSMNRMKLPMRNMLWNGCAMLFCAVLMVGCKKEETITFTDNTIPLYENVSTLLIENYVNRVFIDLIGREPTDTELTAEARKLENASLSMTSRRSLVDKLMTDDVTALDNITYKEAYHNKLYEDLKGRYLNGASEVDLLESYYLYYFISVQDSLNGNLLAYEVNRNQALIMRAVIDCKTQLEAGSITIREASRRMCFNQVYDDINMNTFNYINATFDDLFFRFPTEAELNQAFPPIDYNGSGYLFGQLVTSKSAYISVMVNNAEFNEGAIRWAYLNLLGREALSGEIFGLLSTFNNNDDFKSIQKAIIITDEYAGWN